MICRGGKRGTEEAEEVGERGVVGRDTVVQRLYNIWEDSQSISKRKDIALLLLLTKKKLPSRSVLVKKVKYILTPSPIASASSSDLTVQREHPLHRQTSSACEEDLMLWLQGTR